MMKGNTKAKAKTAGGKRAIDAEVEEDSSSKRPRTEDVAKTSTSTSTVTALSLSSAGPGPTRVRRRRPVEGDPEASKKLEEWLQRNEDRIVGILQEGEANRNLAAAAPPPSIAAPSGARAMAAAPPPAYNKAWIQDVKAKVLNVPRPPTAALASVSPAPEDPKLKHGKQVFADTLESVLSAFEDWKAPKTSASMLASATPLASVRREASSTSAQAVSGNTFLLNVGIVESYTELPPAVVDDLKRARELYKLEKLRDPLEPPRIASIPWEDDVSQFTIFGIGPLLKVIARLAFYKLHRAKALHWSDFGDDSPASWQSDAYFVEQRLRGVNPCALEILKPEQRDLFADSGEPLASGTFFMCDYARVLGEFASDKLPACRLLLSLQGTGNASFLRAEAVRIERPNGQHVIIRRTDPNQAKWKFAKTCVRVADWSAHELGSHLTLCHLISEAFIVITHKCLPSLHPVFQLLMPHTFRTLPLNGQARSVLVPLLIAQVLNPLTTDDCFKLCSSVFANWHFTEHYVPQDLQRRGVDVLPIELYPYRVTALNTWNCIRDYVKSAMQELVDKVPQDSTIIANDVRLQNWSDEAMNVFMGFPNLKEMTNDDLFDALTLIIFTATHQHSAVNYFQSKYMSFLPVAPGFIERFPDDLDNLDEDELIELFPSIQAGNLQRVVGQLLSQLPDEDHTLTGFKFGSTSSPHYADWDQLSRVVADFQPALKKALGELNLPSTDRIDTNNLAQSVLI